MSNALPAIGQSLSPATSVTRSLARLGSRAGATAGDKSRPRPRRAARAPDFMRTSSVSWAEKVERAAPAPGMARGPRAAISRRRFRLRGPSSAGPSTGRAPAPGASGPSPRRPRRRCARATSGFSFRKLRAASRPWPMRSPAKEYQAPLFSTTPPSDAEVEQLALERDALVVEDVELGLAERRRDLVLHHLDPRAVADHLLALLDGGDAADVEAHRGVELERVAAAWSSRGCRT